MRAIAPPPRIRRPGGEALKGKGRAHSMRANLSEGERMFAAPTWTKFSEATKADLDAIEAEESRSSGLIPARLLE